MPPELLDALQRARWDAWEAAGHYETCEGWTDDPQGNVTCSTCLEAVPVPEEVKA